MTSRPPAPTPYVLEHWRYGKSRTVHVAVARYTDALAEEMRVGKNRWLDQLPDPGQLVCGGKFGAAGDPHLSDDRGELCRLCRQAIDGMEHGLWLAREDAVIRRALARPQSFAELGW